jgi:hypothetical protein
MISRDNIATFYVTLTGSTKWYRFTAASISFTHWLKVQPFMTLIIVDDSRFADKFEYILLSTLPEIEQTFIVLSAAELTHDVVDEYLAFLLQ